MIAIVDYGCGNLFSLASSLRSIGIDPVVTGDERIIRTAEKIILPGVGAFGDARKKLAENGLDKVIIEMADNKTPLLGICLGMQLLFEKSFEYGEHEGLGLIPGKVAPFEGMIDPTLKIPHIGWNALHFTQPESPLLKNNTDGEHFYFVHSFHAIDCDEFVVATAEYGIEVTAAVQRGNVFGAQFHPEKSGEAGLKMLKAFAEIF